jgi:hypothetical protein
MFGEGQPVILHLLDIEPAIEALQGVKMELMDAAFPLLYGVWVWAWAWEWEWGWLWLWPWPWAWEWEWEWAWPIQVWVWVLLVCQSLRL